MRFYVFFWFDSESNLTLYVDRFNTDAVRER
jgi:hypothetical protein